MYWDYSACRYYIKNIDKLDYKPSRPIIEERINIRKNQMLYEYKTEIYLKFYQLLIKTINWVTIYNEQVVFI